MLSIVVPVYNECESLPSLYARITEVAAPWRHQYEVILVDDGSTDHSFRTMCELNKLDPRWKVLRLSRNFGQQPAIAAGVSRAGGDWIGVIDADLQDPPEIFPLLIEKLREGYDVAYAIRRKRKEPLLKRAGSYLYYRILASLANIRIPVDAGEFCVMDRKVVEALKTLPEKERYIRGLRSWVGFRQIGVEYERDKRARGKSKYNYSAMLALAFEGILNFSYKPLRWVLLTGLVMFLVSFILGLIVLLQWLYEFRIFGMLPQDVPGWTSIILVLLFLFGMQFIAMGVVAEYIARLFREVKGRPTYIVSEQVGFDT